MKEKQTNVRLISRLETKEKRKSQDCKVYELKFDSSRFSKEKKEYLNRLFLEAKWLYNSMIASEDIFKFNDKIKTVIVLNKDREPEKRNLNNLSSQMKQDIKARCITSIKSLSTKKKRNQHKKKTKNNRTGKLKFKNQVNSIPLRQYGITYKFSGSKYVTFQGFKKAFKINGFKQIPKNAEFANANLIKKASGYYLKVTCFIPKEEKIFEEKHVGIDFGISTSLTLSDEEKIDINFPVSKKTKKLQRQNKRMKKGSSNKYKHQKKINRSIERTTNQKKDKRNKIVSKIVKKFETVVVQNESIKAWHSSRFGKKVQSSSIGGIMSDLKKKSHTLIVVDKYFPSTKLCPECGTLNNPSLSDRIYKCDCGYSMDRDVHAAKNILREGLKMIGREPINTISVEELLDSSQALRAGEGLFPLKQEAQVFKLGQLTETHAENVECLFDIELNQLQKDAINSCMKTGMSQVVWDRGRGNSFCRMIESLYLSIYYFKNILTVCKSYAEMQFHLRTMEEFLFKNKSKINIKYKYIRNKGIFFGKDYGIDFTQVALLKCGKLKGMRFDKILGDNINGVREYFIENEYHQYTKSLRFYITL